MVLATGVNERLAALVAASKGGGGLITQADLDAYQTREFPPLECDYRDFHIVSAPPPPSSVSLPSPPRNVCASRTCVTFDCPW